MGLSQRRERLIGRLKVAKTRSREGAVLVEGVRQATEALDAGADVSFALVSERLGGGDAATRLRERLVERLGGGDGPAGSGDAQALVTVTEAELDALSDTERGQGVLLVCAEPVASLADVHSGGRYLVLDGVQDPGNVGTLVRAAVAFGLNGVLSLDGTADPWGAKSVRASAGMVFRLPIVRARLPEALARLAEVSVPVWVAAAGGEDVARHPGVRSFALTVGNEGDGVREELAGAAQGALAVRMPGPAESLNVAMAGAILLHSMTRNGLDD